MPTNSIMPSAALRLPRLAATAFICLTIGANTHGVAANTSGDVEEVISVSMNALPTFVTPSSWGDDGAGQEVAKNMQVLSPKDADLYRAAFDAQAKQDWATADTAIADIKDRKLLGHVLADRYQRQAATSAQLRQWLASYSDLPEAPALYEKARHMPAAKGSTITLPSTASSWNGGLEAETALGFRPAANDNENSEVRRFAGKVDRILRHGNPMDAKTLLDAELKRRELTATEHADIASRIAAGLFYDGQTGNARILADEALYGRDPNDQNPLALWIGGLSAWKEGDVPAAGKFFVRLAGQSDLTPWDRSAVDFWAYRSMKQQGDTHLARYWLEQTAKQPNSFYGLLAVHLLGNSEAKSWQMPDMSAKNVAALSSRPAGWRALALIQIGQTELAEAELHHLNPLSNRDLQEAMLAVAEQSHMPSLAMKLGGIATTDNGKHYEAALYPLPPWQPEQGFRVDRALMYALIRHESGFNPVAMSNQGACGLMQLMPATATLVANDNKVMSNCSGRLMNPAYNMALGQKYVQRLAAEPMIGDNLLLLLAAYNSGPGNVAQWLDDDATRKDPLLFIESMPVHETRDYVQQVMIHYWNYCSRLSKPQTTLAQLAKGEWPRANVNDTAPAASRTKQMRVMNDGIRVASK